MFYPGLIVFFMAITNIQNSCLQNCKIWKKKWKKYKFLLFKLTFWVMELRFPCLNFHFSEGIRSLFEKRKEHTIPPSPTLLRKLCWKAHSGSQGVWKRTRNHRSGQCWHCLKSPANKHTNWSQMVKVHFYHVLCGLMIPINIFLLCIHSGQHLRNV